MVDRSVVPLGTDDVFTYHGNIVVHPIVFRSRIGHERNIIEYEVRQTGFGAEIDVRAQAPVANQELAAAIEGDLSVLATACATRCVDRVS